jgi:hypothetical protein
MEGFGHLNVRLGGGLSSEWQMAAADACMRPSSCRWRGDNAAWTVVCGIIFDLPYKDLKNISCLLGVTFVRLPSYGTFVVRPRRGAHRSVKWISTSSFYMWSLDIWKHGGSHAGKWLSSWITVCLCVHTTLVGGWHTIRICAYICVAHIMHQGCLVCDDMVLHCIVRFCAMLIHPLWCSFLRPDTRWNWDRETREPP